MAHEAQLEREARAGPPIAAAAFASAVLSVVTLVLQADALRNRPRGDRGLLIRVDERATQLVASSVTQALALLLLGAVLWHLYRVTKYRRTQTPAVGLTLAVVGPLFLAVAGVLNQLEIVGIAGDFAESGPRTANRAEDLLADRTVVGAILGFAGQLSLAFSLVVINLNALRAGVESRFLGIIGIIVGALYVLGGLFGGPLVVQFFWLVALGVVFLGRFPGGRGPAWETGEAVPWPTAADRARARAGAAAPDGESAELEEAEADPGPQPSSRKRKRKRRR